jgi:hypothetical protein
MAAISQKIGNLLGGVSQQPDTNKYNGQLRICDNYYPDAATGLIKRPGLKGIGKLANAVADGTWFHIFRDNNEKYIFQFSKAGVLKVWDAISGIQQTVNSVNAEAISYATHTFAEDLQVLQINDYIFVLNTTKIVSKGATLSNAYSPFGFVNINTVAFNTDYTITIDSTTFTHTTPNNASGSTQNSVQTIITALVNSINASSIYTAQGIGNSIFIRRTNNADFNIKATGGTNGTAVEAFKEVVTSVSQLPREFISGRRIRIEGSTENNADDYWVEFIPATSGQTSGTGHWNETIAPGIILGMDTTSLPHVIIREANGTFTYRQLDEASAIASAGTTIVTGVPTGISIVSATSGGHVVGEEFSITGGTGNNLRLIVNTIKDQTIVNNYSAGSSNYVIFTEVFVGYYSYIWYVNNIQIGETSDETLIIGDTTYTIYGNFEASGTNDLVAGITITQQKTGIIDSVSILQAGQGYTALNTVYNANSDSFQILTVSTQNLNGDEVRLNYWKNRTVGDLDSNPFPSFVDNTIDGISFFKNRIIFTSRQNVICSQAGDYFNFFASTVITIVDSDPIDISAGSLKPVHLKYMLPVPRGLALFGNNGQYILETTTEAFAPKTAEVNLLSTYNESEKVSPVDIGPSFLFIEEGVKASSIFEMDIKDNIGGKPAIVELTRLIPTYIPSAIVSMKSSQSTGTVALLSKQALNYLYLYRFFQQGDSRISGWFRWKLPGTIESFDFDKDVLYVVTKQNNNYILSSMSLLTDTPNESLLFDGQYLDVRLDLFDYNPVRVYDSSTNTTHICFKDGFENTTEQPVLMYLNPDVAGYFEEQTLQYDASKPTGQKYFLVAEGNQTTSKFAIGYKYEALAQLPAFYFMRDEGKALKDTLNIPRVSRITVNSYNSGPYKAVVRAEGRKEFTLSLPQINANYYKANNIPIIRNAQSSIPILAKGNQFEFELIADAPFPTAFTSLNWEGTYNNKGVSSL